LWARCWCRSGSVSRARAAACYSRSRSRCWCRSGSVSWANWCILILCVYTRIFIFIESSANYIRVSGVTNSYYMTNS
jgi:hypothetical protein